MERDTRQRRAIRAALERADRPLSPKEVLSASRRRIRTLGLATVYRTLNTMVADGWLVEVQLPGEPPRYEMAGKTHHHHFVCDRCHRVFEVHACPGDMSGMVPAAFELSRHEIVLYGICADCAARAASRAAG
jgi:Fur family transcriptional regulator, ferric uptake regulator